MELDQLGYNLESTELRTALLSWKKFEKQLSNQGKIGLIYHGDADGVISAAYLLHRLESTVGKDLLKLLWIGTEEYDFGSLRTWLESEKLDSCVVTDIAVENHPPTLKELSSRVSNHVFIYDHHVLNSNIEVYENISLVNPTPKKLRRHELPFPAFIFGYALAKEYGLNFPTWLLILAIFNEGVESHFEDFLRTAFRENFSIHSAGSLRDLFQQTELPLISSLIRASFSVKEKSHSSLELLQEIVSGNLNSGREFKTRLHQQAGKHAKYISQSISHLVSQWEPQISERHSAETLICIPVESGHSVAGPVASILRGKFPEKVILTYVSILENTVIELRTGNDSPLNLVDCLRGVAKEVELINFGGHPMAAGALIQSRDFDKFVKVLRKELVKGEELGA